MRNKLTYLIILENLVCYVITWHDLTNVNYHCWPYDASAAKPTPFTSCPGMDIRWIIEPPSELKVEDFFNTTYELLLRPNFYPWATTKGIFDGANSTGFSDSALAQQWCESVQCPSPESALPENCCIHHVNVHSCPLSQKDTVQNGLCGPWIPPSGSIFTHSEVMVGSPIRGNWTSQVAGLYQEGATSIIAHFKVAKMHIAVEKTVSVSPKTVCGDGRCEVDIEDCSTCPKDCGSCPLADDEIALIVVFSLLVVIVFIVVIMYFRYQKRKLLWDESWIISYEDIHKDKGLRGIYGSMVSVVSGSISGSEKTGSSIAQTASRKQLFASTATHDGQTVAVKRIEKTELKLNMAVRLEVKTVRELDHPNLCKFIGGCIEVPNVCILTEYCPKGSLNDVLLNDDIPLSWAFRFSFASDIARGLGYLHSHGLSHGHLTSSNCVLDDRWTLKVTDFGLPLLRHDDIVSEEDADNIKYKELQTRVYIAPELRRGTYSKYMHHGTCPGDVYSFSILLVEIANRNDAYEDEDPHDLPGDWKPSLDDIDDDKNANTRCPCPFQYCKLIKDCWSDKPVDRPTFDSIKKTLYKINPNKLSAVDLMMNMMEKYSKHLESLVVDRTQDLMAEKQKTDKLLYSMLPRSVADILRQGSAVNAEQFDDCTIYFSDIVGFTTISGQSSAMQVVALLNKLYTTFDEIIDRFDVYKVETIGDAYMVVSGVPVPTQFHAREISDMALEIVSACKVFTIPHLPEEPLQIRVGLHSGSVCAGVVGLKMPRYCLFGDTVNTASRMESNGEAYRVHISSSTHSCLSQLGCYTFQKRGSIPIKGKGEMITWWLVSRLPSTADDHTVPSSVSSPVPSNTNNIPHHDRTRVVLVKEKKDSRQDSAISSGVSLKDDDEEV